MKLFLSLLPFIGSVLAMSIPRQEAEIASCICESVFCAQSWPDSCYCANEAKRACFEQCGGDVPVYDTCPPRDVTARAPEAVPEPQPQPDVAAPPPTCECEETFCLQSWPESCHCQNNAKKACFDKCGGEVPTYQTCPPLPTPEVPKAESAPDCKCTEINCTPMWPTGCYCRYYAKQLCYEECGGERPTLDICYDNSTSGLTTRTMEAAPAPLAARAEAKHMNQKCGGNNGYGSPLPPCPSGQICIQDPFKPESCGPAGGEAGICVEAKMCGGLMGLECKTKGQICVDNPMDDCDPKKGGADCAGVCVWPQ